MHKALIQATILLATFVLGACGTNVTTPGGERTTFTAVVIDLPEDPIAPGTISRVLVQHPGQAEPADRSIVHISAATTIVRRTSDGIEPGTVSDIRIGDTVIFRIEDLELRSYPRQVFATRIEL